MIVQEYVLPEIELSVATGLSKNDFLAFLAIGLPLCFAFFVALNSVVSWLEARDAVSKRQQAVAETTKPAARGKAKRTAMQWFGLALAVTGIPVGLWLFFDFTITVAMPAIQAGNSPVIDFATNLKVMTPIVVGIIGANLFIHKDQAPERDD